MSNKSVSENWHTSGRSFVSWCSTLFPPPLSCLFSSATGPPKPSWPTVKTGKTLQTTSDPARPSAIRLEFDRTVFFSSFRKHKSQIYAGNTWYTCDDLDTCQIRNKCITISAVPLLVTFSGRDKNVSSVDASEMHPLNSIAKPKLPKYIERNVNQIKFLKFSKHQFMASAFH